MVRNSLLVVDRTEKGLLWFRFIESHTVFLLSPLGKLQVKWSDVSEKQTLFKLVKNLLVAKPNEKLSLRPVKQQTWIEYPVPNSFKLYWCNKATEFVLNPSSETQSTDEERKQVPRSVSARKRGSLNGSRVKEKEVRIIMALQEIRYELRFFREPTLNEVAVRSDCLNERKLKETLRLAGWQAQSPECAKREAEQAINLAGWRRFEESHNSSLKLHRLCREAQNRANSEVIARAEKIFKNYPGLVPVVN
jgi:hypothetical protein